MPQYELSCWCAEQRHAVQRATCPIPWTHPNTARACAVASRGCCGAAVTKAAMSAVSEQPAAVMSVSSSCPLRTPTTAVPSVTCARGEG